MQPYIFTKCPSCSGQMRFKRPETERFVVVCPSCQHHFDSGTSQFEKGLIPATLVSLSDHGAGLASSELEASGIGAAQANESDFQRGLISEEAQIRVESPGTPILSAGPTKPTTARSSERTSTSERLPLDDLLPAQPLRPVRAINLGSTNASARWDSSVKRSMSRHSRKWLSPAVIVSLLFGLLCIGGLVFLLAPELRVSLGIGRYREIGLAQRYADLLEQCQRRLMGTQETLDDPEAFLSSKLKELDALLIDCIQTGTISESRHQALRAEMQELFSKQLAFKELAHRVVPNLQGENRLQFAKVAALISLIDLRLTYGLRELPPGTSEIEAYCRNGVSQLRELDQLLLTAREKGFDQQLDEIASILDEIDQLALERSRSGELRADMPYDFRRLVEASEGWQRWCLDTSNDKPTTLAIQRAIGQERIAAWDRFQLGLSAASIPPNDIAALDRLHRRMSAAVPNLTVASLLAANETQAAKMEPPNQPMIGSKAPESAEPSGIESQKVAGAASSTKPPPSSVGSVFGIVSQARETPSSDASSPATSPGSLPPASSEIAGSDLADAPESVTVLNPPRVDSGKPQAQAGISSGRGDRTSDEIGNDLKFPQPLHTGPNALCIKVQSRRPDWIREQAMALGRQLKLTPDIQVTGSLVTISFNSYSGKAHEATGLVKFGTIEIVDGQSRTLFVVD